MYVQRIYGLDTAFIYAVYTAHKCNAYLGSRDGVIYLYVYIRRLIDVPYVFTQFIYAIYAVYIHTYLRAQREGRPQLGLTHMVRFFGFESA